MAESHTLSIKGISKQFGAVRALSQVNIDFLSGEIHAVLGENGAGKSTLMNVLAGLLLPDSGAVSLDGEDQELGDPIAIRRNGIGMVHQHFMLVPGLSVAENLILFELVPWNSQTKRSEILARAREIAGSLGWEFDWNAKAADLPVGTQQRIEILKVLCDEPDVMILDEPTAVLSEAEIDDLFSVLRKIRDSGSIVIMIAHKLSEIMQIANRVSVLRMGELVGTDEIGNLSAEKIAEWMIGQPPTTTRSTQAPISNEIVAEAIGLAVCRTKVTDVSFKLNSGEILGIAGVDGNGQLELAEALIGLRPITGHWRAPRAIGYIPQDRQSDGLALGLSIRDNYVIQAQNMAQFQSGPWLRTRAINNWAEQLVHDYRVKLNAIDDPAASLSGGNQQKIVVSRVLASKPELLIAMNPTRGLDFSATEFVHQALQQAAESGTAILLISTDRDEIAKLAHRTLYMNSGNLDDQLSNLVGL